VVGPVVDLAVLLEQLQPLGQRPLRRELAAVAGQPRLAALLGERVDPVRLRLRGVVLPQLHVRVRALAELVQLAQRGAVVEDRQQRARGEVGGDADHLLRVDAGVVERAGHGLLQHLDVVGRHLQGPLGRERLAAGGQRAVHHGVGVVAHRLAQHLAVGHPDDHRATGQRAVVDADDEAVAVARPGVRRAFGVGARAAGLGGLLALGLLGHWLPRRGSLELVC
jgi:hypothetical protein